MFVSLITPYTPKEEARFQQILPRLLKTMSEWVARDTKTRKWEFLLVYDTLSNVKAQTMSQLRQKHAEIRPVLMNSKLVGKGSAFGEGFTRADGDVCGLYDIEEQMTPEDLPYLYEALEVGGYDAAHGIRHQSGAHFEKQVQNENMMCRKMLGGFVSDYLTCLSAYRTKMVKGLQLVEDDHLFIPDILVRRGLRAEMISECVTRYEGTDKKSGFGALASGLGEMGRIRKFKGRLQAGLYDKMPGQP